MDGDVDFPFLERTISEERKHIFEENQMWQKFDDKLSALNKFALIHLALVQIHLGAILSR